MGDGFYVNASAFPAVPRGQGGVRFTQTLYHSDSQIEAVIESMARHLPEFVEDPAVQIDLTPRHEDTVVVQPG